LRIAQDRNAVGKATNLDVQIVQRNLIQAEVDEGTARVGYIEALTSLYAAEGTLLERRGIRLDDEGANR
jgi:outer membrane protein TolC